MAGTRCKDAQWDMKIIWENANWQMKRMWKDDQQWTEKIWKAPWSQMGIIWKDAQSLSFTKEKMYKTLNSNETGLYTACALLQINPHTQLQNTYRRYQIIDHQ